ncbi:MAG: hypothetical protein US83_C0001G0031 [Candidatus Falkowbacteria bacterium GW2011_GWC2_38_22]|uniref:Uncharacterized protein n=1 Tax=Candidatus Falkowbacteria bacterium GW2011_GWE1_38_31 TaxID=1618638 RepID=A0A0G0JWB8_9BACT|nr:MAG: hypothetical protein US73_C0004G0097 [Candidatus Falkowbacteria bacterium GW2011_GWF2_38_1205]KKQ62097.1 MAG: hypothetical protein US83_C0001G0031 [Candidatus Falkowbacteria bacterium GW2011_GWC2_38_22]KKQ64247.1 MAG: hypothetical protein US84_C0001G0031 [Candidatus Falkowbacteria bacterium GW2011_GWF1_38_22]KKQ66224.1 MAG: hypothetical protein US87_C0002G0031 [Candidatus Falkowbacteria bacterium GW2011_GWE2_38_254]KKQ70952.1 MAG: hypothetical protein US91_C0002G0031 [Candidatus Falkowb
MDKKLIIKKSEIGEDETGGNTEQLTSQTTTITGISSGFGNVRAVNVLGLGFGNSPIDLAKIFLEFVSATTVPCTEEELSEMSQIIVNIHQRYYKKNVLS